MRLLKIATMTAMLLAAVVMNIAAAETETFQIEPSGAQIQMFPGHSSTTGFLVRAGTSGKFPEKGLLTLADWEFDIIGNVVYKEAGTTRRSAASWLTIQPISLPLAPGDVKLVRLTVRIPADAAPGVYTSAVLVTRKAPEFSPSIPDLPGSPRAYCAFTLLITVRAPAPNRGAELTMIPR